MVINENDWIKIDYIGRLKENSKVFDTTMEDVARSENIFDEKHKYEPMLCRAGDEKFLIPGLAKRLIGLELNKTETFEIPTKEAYGERDSSKIEMIPTKKLRNAKIDPRVGSMIQFQGRYGRIIFVGGGRTRVDFNHPLAGKDLVFDVTIVEHIEDEDVIRKEIISRRLPGVNLDELKIETSKDNETITITLPNYLIFMEGIAISKYTLANDLHEFLNYKIIRFMDVFDHSDKKEVEQKEDQKDVSSSEENNEE
ncbi:MAG: FKBP-type peptidyl-prolyl cis-trans isomerase [Candidatus Hodarchaeales archaeon]